MIKIKEIKDKIYEIIITNKIGNSIKITNYGATIMSVNIKDKNKKMHDVILGFDTIDEYMEKNKEFSFGATCGRFANRIENGKFNLNGKTYILSKNDKNNTLHGGDVGFNQKVFDLIFPEITNKEENMVIFRLVSLAGDMGFPGELELLVQMTFDDKNTLTINYVAKTTEDTLINFTNHMYFNLSNPNVNALSHILKINADYFLPLNENFVPNGVLKEVKGTPFDFRNEKELGKDINEDEPQLKLANGYDHCFVVNGEKGKLRDVASVFSKETGIGLNIKSDLEGVQLYSANFLNEVKGKGATYNKNYALCLETEFFPNNINIKNFIPSILKKGETFKSMTSYSFYSC